MDKFVPYTVYSDVLQSSYSVSALAAGGTSMNASYLNAMRRQLPKTGHPDQAGHQSIRTWRVYSSCVWWEVKIGQVVALTGKERPRMPRASPGCALDHNSV